MTFEFLDLVQVVAAMLTAGLAAGLIAGLLGVGGGIVIVPVLFTLLGAIDVPEAVRMHVAVGTSLSTIMATSISSTMAHNRRDAVDWSLLRRWSPTIVLGVVGGSVLSAFIDGDGLTGFFGVVAALVALYMIIVPDTLRVGGTMPGQPVLGAIGFGIGSTSVLMGIGGGTLGVSTMTLFGVPIHRAVGTAAGIGLLIAVPGTIGFCVTGWRADGLPPLSIGYVNLVGFALLVPMTVIAAPWGARLAHRLSRRHLRMAFGLFLALTSVRMLTAAWY